MIGKNCNHKKQKEFSPRNDFCKDAYSLEHFVQIFYDVTLHFISYYKTNKFSHDLAFLPNFKICLNSCLLFSTAPFCWFRLRLGLSWTWANMPTNNSSTLWSRPLDVSMNLHLQLNANLRPAGTCQKLIAYYCRKNCSFKYLIDNL